MSKYRIVLHKEKYFIEWKNWFDTWGFWRKLGYWENNEYVIAKYDYFQEAYDVLTEIKKYEESKKMQIIYVEK